MDVCDLEEENKKDEIDGGGKSKISFHIATIKKPQDEFNIPVNNVNKSFEHVFLEKHEDDTLHYIHPLEKLSVMDFVDKDVNLVKPVKPLPLEETHFKLVEEVQDLEDLAAKLHSVDEFSVDLEHNQYRSFQGLTCLMQISTRTGDYVVDTFKLWYYIGPYLREIFKDPRKKKVMHGADRDVIWLQRDFGIYVCNLFDTGQASRVLKLERKSLEFLLKHYCGVAANKQYQNADWRIRPLPEVMTRYAREDTHYLLYIYDVMRIELHALAKENEESDPPLVEVYKRSYDVCMQLYEKELLTADSYLHIYGVHSANFNAVQLAIVAGLCDWRDPIARANDESPGYVLPNKVLLNIAKEMPINAGKLRRLLKSKLPYVDRNLDAVVSVIRRSMLKAAAFEPVVQSLKDWRPRTVSEKNIESTNEETFTEVVASSPSSEKLIHVESISSTTGLLGSGQVSVDLPQNQSGGFGTLPSKRKFESDNKAEEDDKVSKAKPNDVIIVVDSDSDDDEEEEEDTPEAEDAVDRVSEMPVKGPDVIPVSTHPKTTFFGQDVIVLTDEDSDDDDDDDGDDSNNNDSVDGTVSRGEGISSKPGKFMTMKPGFLNF